MDSHPEGNSLRRLIKRYSNRKLYDTGGSRYVTLLEIADMVRAGEEVQIIDNQTKEDKTEVTLALIISEELKARPRGIPIATLKALIRHRGERLLSTLREGPILGRLMAREESSEPPAPSPPAREAPESAGGANPAGEASSSSPGEPAAPLSNPPTLGALRRTLEQWQAAVDERLRSVLPESVDVEELRLEVRALSERLTRLEKHLLADEKKSE